MDVEIQMGLDLGFDDDLAELQMVSTYRVTGTLTVEEGSERGGGSHVRVTVTDLDTAEVVAEKIAVVQAITVRKHDGTDTKAAWIERAHTLKLLVPQ